MKKGRSEMKVYIASSWRNADLAYTVAEFLREAGLEVDAFMDSSKGRYVFNWREIVKDKNKLNAITFLRDERSQRAFQEDKKWLDWCDACVLVLPAGNSSHLEAGYTKGQGKKLIIYSLKFPKGEFDVMYGFADLLTTNISMVIQALQGKGKLCELASPKGEGGRG